MRKVVRCGRGLVLGVLLVCISCVDRSSAQDNLLAVEGYVQVLSAAPHSSRALLQAAAAAAVQPAAQPAAAAENAAAVQTQTTVNTTTVAATAPAPALAEASNGTAAAAAPAKAPVKKNQNVQMAPEVEVENDDDVDAAGKCKTEIDTFCKGVEVGEGKVAECLSEQISDLEVKESDSGARVSKDCREEVFQYYINRSTNINKNIPLAKACKLDAEQHCNVTWFFGYHNGSIIACLRDIEIRDQLSAKCKKEVFKVQLAAAKDIRSDHLLWEKCKKDAERLCANVEHGGGRIQSCLRDNRIQLTWECEEQLFRQDKENADDIRLSVRLFRKCLPDKKKFCSQVAPGNARAKMCLEEHRDEVSRQCKEELDKMIEARVRDFRLDSRLQKACEDDIYSMCAHLGDLESMDTYDSSVINCLQDYQKEISGDECRAQVKKYMELASQDIRFNMPLADACGEDRRTLCANVPPGSARVIRCLQNQREKLSQPCRATLFDEEVRFSENIDFQYPLKKACEKEVSLFCKDIPHGNARVIRCLQDNKNAKDFGRVCKDEVQRYEQNSAKDFRLNFRLSKACKDDIKLSCKDVCKLSESEQVCGGKVLHCLTTNKDKIRAADCKKEVFYYEKMEVSDFRTDILLAEACRTDVDKFCANVKPGEGRVHKCLRDHSKELTPACRKEETRIEELEASNIELAVGLLKACSDERQMFCKEVSPGQARVFRCLVDNLGSPDFGAACKYQLMAKLQRRQNNWRLDPPLRKACRDDVADKCAAEDEARSENGAVFRCLIRVYDDLSSGCARELGRSVHMALLVWRPEGSFTNVCDADVRNVCLAKDKKMTDTPGAVSSCLSALVPTPLTSPTRRLLQDPAKPAAKPEAAKVAAAAKPEPAKAEPAKPAAAAPDPAKPVAAKPAEKKPAPKPAENKPLPKVAPAKSTPKVDEAAVTKQITEKVLNATSGGKRKQAPVATLGDECNRLINIATPPDTKAAFDNSLGMAFLTSQLDTIESSTGVPLVHRDRAGAARAISLTGYTALAGMISLVIVLIYGASMLYKRVKGFPEAAGDYTLVVKGRSGR